MNQTQYNRQPSEFTFYQGTQKGHKIHQQNNEAQQLGSDDNFMISLDSFIQQFQASNNDQTSRIDTAQKKVYKSIHKDELEKVFKYFRKYEPLYFNKMQIKTLSYQFKKGVEIKKYKQGYYFGEILQTQSELKTLKFKHGKGILVYGLFKKNQTSTKKIYEGEWANDKKQGLGFEKFQDGSVYHGFYRASKPEGKGKFTNHKGQIYEGQWKNGTKQGRGFWKGVHGETYIGEWSQGKPEGYGVFVTQKGDRYEGQFKNSMKHGQGIQKFINGDIYKGLYENDKPGGFGQYYWKNKSYFKGYFKNGLRCGQGLWKRGAGNCDKYEGQYQNDKKWGYGIFTWQNGNIYKGNYTGDTRNGYGQMIWLDGSYYNGNWKDGVQHGKGQLFIVGQGLRIGLFQNNQIVQTQYEEPITDQENQENQQLPQKTEYNQIQTNKFQSSNFSIRTKKTKLQKAAIQKEKPKILLNKKRQNLSLSNSELNNFRKMPSVQKQNGMRSVPLKQLFQKSEGLFQKSEGSRYFSTNSKQPAFRITKKLAQSSKGNQSFDQSRVSTNQKRKNRILHSSFYLHKFKNIGKPNSTKSQNKNFFNPMELNFTK